MKLLHNLIIYFVLVFFARNILQSLGVFLNYISEQIVIGLFQIGLSSFFTAAYLISLNNLNASKANYIVKVV